VKVRKKGVIILPKAVRVEVGMEEDSIVELEARDGSLVLRPIRVKLAEVSPKSAADLVRRIKREERELEERKVAEAFDVKVRR